ncbi:MAG TPA: hypothetical protein VIH37_04400, partial [Candidatus Limnocylindrales bacterium]
GASAKSGSDAGAKWGSGAGAKAGAGRASDGTSGSKSGRTGGQGRGGGARTGGTRIRAERRTARPGSTTYDEAKQPLDPSWAGGEWYGASSGRYWTINPREYADPRKHGPEYQERARRAADLEASRWHQANPPQPPPPPSFASNAWAAPPPPSPAHRDESRASGEPRTGAPQTAERQASAPRDPASTAGPASRVDRLRRLVGRSNGHGAP